MVGRSNPKLAARRMSLVWGVGIAVGLWVTPLEAQVTLSIGRGSATAGGSATFAITLATSGGAQPSGLEWTMSYPAGSVTSVTVTDGSATTAASKTVTCNTSLTSGSTICLITGMNNTVISPGDVAEVTIGVAANVTTTVPVQMGAVNAAGVDGSGIVGSGNGGTIAIGTTPNAIACAPIWVNAPGKTLCTVSLAGPPPTAAFPVTLSSSQASVAVPPSVSVAAGSSSATFTATVGSVSSNFTAIIGASANGVTQTFLLAVVALSTPLRFVPITPCRVVDTRVATFPFGGTLAAQTSRDFPMSASSCEVPSSAQAYSVNVTAVPPGGIGYLSLWPTNLPQPIVSILNSDGRVKANAAIVGAGDNNSVSIYTTDTTDIVLDINGYFVPANTNARALAFYPLPPCRVADTRNTNGPMGGPMLASGETRTFPVLSSSCGIPSTAQAYSLNFTVVPPNGVGYLSTWPAGSTQPVVSTLNSPGTIVANAAIVAAGTNGDIAVYASDNTDVVIDIDGYFAPAGAGGLSFYSMLPCRALDTRNPVGTAPFNGTIVANMLNSGCGVPSAAQAFALNATVVPPSGFGYLSLWPDSENRPLVSTLNAFDGKITSNFAIVPTTNGSIDAFGSSAAYLILDVSGYFAP